MDDYGCGKKVELRLETAVWIRMIRAYYSIFNDVRKALSQYEITVPQFYVLSELGYRGSLQLKELGRRLAVTMGNITGIVDRMEEAGYLYREKDLKDRRVTWVKMTSRGREIYEALVHTFQKEIETKLERLDRKELKELSKILRKISDYAI